MRISLEGKRVFITAGAAGIGRATVMAMHRLGATVFTCDIDQTMLDSLPDDVTSYVCDVSNSDEIDAIFDEILPEGLDLLINNAGVSGPTKLVEDITNEEWRACMAVNIDAQFYCVRRVVPIFKKQQSGAIINLLSGAGIQGYPTRSPYVAAKWASNGFTQTLAMELGPDNIRVNGIVPGCVSGDRMDRVIKAHAKLENMSEDDVRRLYAIGTSMQCYVDPEEIADMICFLCSDYAKHVSGQTIGVDGNTEILSPRS